VVLGTDPLSELFDAIKDKFAHSDMATMENIIARWKKSVTEHESYNMEDLLRLDEDLASDSELILHLGPIFGGLPLFLLSLTTKRDCTTLTITARPRLSSLHSAIPPPPPPPPLLPPSTFTTNPPPRHLVYANISDG
jgi:hypothetical protein